MATNPGQGNTTQGNYVSFPPGGTTTNVYVYTTVANPVVGTVVFWSGDGSVTAPAGTYKFSVTGGGKKKATVNSLGVITAIVDCSWSSTKYNSDTYTANKNDCAAGTCTVVGNSVTLNYNGTNTYTTSGTYTSYLSQADADAQAQAIADAAFVAGRQAKINEYGSCTWTASNISDTYPATSYTRNNCTAGCTPTSVTYQAVTKSGYSAVSNNSCLDATNTAKALAYEAARQESVSLGQAYANANGSCCCWVSDPYCVPSTCNYQGNRQRNTCTGEYRYTETTSTTNCSCGDTCGGTTYTYYCGGQYNYDRYRILKYNCTNGDAGSAELFQSCSANCNSSSSPVYENQNYVTCYFCANVTVYKDINHCSGTNGKYFVYYNNSYVNVGTQPTGGVCNTDSNCIDVGSAYCYNGDYVIDRSQNNPCSGESCPRRVIQSQSVTYGCYDPCAGNTAPNYEAQGYNTCYSCNNVAVYRDVNSCSSTYLQYYVDYYGYVYVGGQPNGNACNYQPACVDTGTARCEGPNYVISQTQTNPCAGACDVRVIQYNSVTYGCYDPCAGNTAPYYTDQGYTTCYNCNNLQVYKDTNSCSTSYNGYYLSTGSGYQFYGSQPSGGSCDTSSYCVDSGSAYCYGPNWVINRVQGNSCSSAGCTSPWVLEPNSQTHGCYTPPPPPTCYTYDLFMYGSTPEYVNVQYTNCAGGVDYLSAYNDGGDGYGGTICARAGTAYIYQGTGSLSEQGSCNNT